MLDNVANIVAIELLAAAQGIEFHRPRRSSDRLERVVEQIRGLSEPYVGDRSLSEDIRTLAARTDAGLFYDDARAVLPSCCR
jgi:histidine ammonia-lyase